jgi:hypothetical protein
VDRTQYGAMLVKLHNDYVTGQHDIYPNDRISAFALINNRNLENKKSTLNYNLNGASFTQDGTRLFRGIAFWGCRKEGVNLAQYTSTNGVKSTKQNRIENSQGQQHLNMEMIDEMNRKTYLQDE